MWIARMLVFSLTAVTIDEIRSCPTPTPALSLENVLIPINFFSISDTYVF
jgi:hypothetical protein